MDRAETAWSDPSDIHIREELTMTFTRTIAAAAVGLSLTVSGVLLNEARSDSSPSPSSSISVSDEAVAVHAANKAALVMMCRAGLNDPLANDDYQAAAAAHPDLAMGIATDCSLVSLTP